MTATSHTCPQGPLCAGWEEENFRPYNPDAPSEPAGPDCDHNSCWRIVNDWNVCETCLRETAEAMDR
jgi:hypothetical protein